MDQIRANEWMKTMPSEEEMNDEFEKGKK